LLDRGQGMVDGDENGWQDDLGAGAIFDGDAR
jgi:hypothetical protein